MKSKLILCLALALSGISFGQPFSIPPPPPGSDLPGDNTGKIETYWLAPYVRVSKGFGGTTVTWFADDGRVKRQTAVSVIEPGFVRLPSSRGHEQTILGVNEDWKIILPPEPTNAPRYNMSGYITSTPDNRVFVHEFSPKPGQVALDIYVHGKRVNTAGPFWRYSATDVVLNKDGSAALLIAETNMEYDVPAQGAALRNELDANQRVQARVITFNTNGTVQFKMDCGPAVWSPLVAPDGTGLLLHSNTGTNQNTLMWFTKKAEKVRSLNIGPNSEFAGWIPGTHKSLFSTSFGFETNRYHLIDQDSGKQLWDIPCPGGGQPLAVGLTPKFIIFAVAELYRAGPWRGSEWVFLNSKTDWIRTFYAVNVQSGQIVARWQEFYARRYCDSNYGHFLCLADNFYYIIPDEFTKINFDDIMAKKNGWQ